MTFEPLSSVFPFTIISKKGVVFNDSFDDFERITKLLVVELLMDLKSSAK
jgi:hypothetical protein